MSYATSRVRVRVRINACGVCVMLMCDVWVIIYGDVSELCVPHRKAKMSRISRC